MDTGWRWRGDPPVTRPISKAKAATTRIGDPESRYTDYQQESAFTKHIRHRAEALGWLVYAHPDSRFSFSAGFPDFVMVHPLHGLAFIECKSDTGRFSPDQSAWIDALRVADGTYIVDIWRPRDADRINRFLETGEI